MWWTNRSRKSAVSRATLPITPPIPSSSSIVWISYNYLTVLLILHLSTFIAARTYDLPLPVLPAKCPDNFLLLPNSQHCYGFQVGAPDGNLQTWREANNSCARDGGTLMHIPRQASSTTMFVFLSQKATQMGIQSAWVARTDWVAGAGEDGSQPRSSPIWTNFHPSFTWRKCPRCLSLISTYVEFPPKSTDVQVNTVGCNHEKRNFICDLRISTTSPPLTPFRHLHPRYRASKYHHYRRILDAKAGSREKAAAKTKGAAAVPVRQHVPPPSTKRVNALMPNNLSGLSKIPPVRATELVRARADFIFQIFGTPAVSDDMLAPGFLPAELDTANIRKTNLETAKALLLEIAADSITKHHKGNSTEIAKHLTIELLEEGHPIQCYYGVNVQQRIVACLGPSKIESCAKIVTRNGQVVRSCGLPGMRQSGCHHTIDGVVCYCVKDDCNIASQINLNSFLIFIFVLRTVHAVFV